MAAFDPSRPFTRAHGLAAGLTAGQLRGPGFRAVLHGVFVSAVVPDTPVLRAEAALLVHPPSAVASQFTAVRVVGAPAPRHSLEHVTVPHPDERRRRYGVRCHVAALADDEIRRWAGVRISSPHRLFVGLASFLTLVDLVVVGDWLVRQGHTTTEALVAHCAQDRSRHAGQAREAARYVRARVDSPMETRLRSQGIHRDPAGTVQRVWQALRQRGVRVAAPTDAWRPHFA